MTIEELKNVLKSRHFKSSVKYGDEHYIFTFTEIYIFRNGRPMGIYELIKIGDNFTLAIVQSLQDVFTDNFKNVIVAVPDDNRFPIIINFDSFALQQGKGFDITLEAQ